jgi:hypothetical protein
VFFSATLGAGVARPPDREILRALWLLHEGLRLGYEAADEADRPISALAAYTYGVHRSTAMLRYLNRGRRVLAVDDAHPSVAGTPPLPSAFRAAFTNISGLTTTGGCGRRRP